MSIASKIEEINQYFCQRIVTGDYEFISCDRNTAKIRVNGYVLELWISHNPANDFNFYNYNESNVNLRCFLFIETEEDRVSGFEKMKPLIEEYRHTKVRKDKEAEFEKLKKELEELDNA